MNTNLVSTDFRQIESRIWRISLKMIGGVFLMVICASCRQDATVVILPPTLTSSPRVIHQST